MITKIHGAPHCSKVKVGDSKKFVSVVWNTTDNTDEPVAFDGWYLPTEVEVTQGSNRVTVTSSTDYDGRSQVEVEFIDLGIVDFEVTVGQKTTLLRVEVVA